MSLAAISFNPILNFNPLTLLLRLNSNLYFQFQPLARLQIPLACRRRATQENPDPHKIFTQVRMWRSLSSGSHGSLPTKYKMSNVISRNYQTFLKSNKIHVFSDNSCAVGTMEMRWGMTWMKFCIKLNQTMRVILFDFPCPDSFNV